MKKILNDITHHKDDYECMWNGIEDIYMSKTKETLPENFFFLLSSFGSFCYLKTNKSEIKRMVVLGDGRTKKMYEFLSPIINFEYKSFEFKNYEKALSKAKSEINNGYPVVLGALDMYYLPYFKKLYHKEHIPFHYVLMIGYDDEKQCIYLYDCGRTEMVCLFYNELRNAMNCSYPGLSKENTICTIRMNEVNNKIQILKDALSKKKELFLNPPTNFLGYKGFEKFIHELPKWKIELNKKDYDKILMNMVEFFGTVPTVPNILKGINKPDLVKYMGGFDKMSRMLKNIGKEIKNDSLISAAIYFDKCASIIENISSIIINYLRGKKDETLLLSTLFSNVLENMKKGYDVININ